MPGLKDRIIATLERDGFVEQTCQAGVELPLDDSDANTCPQIETLQGEASNTGTKLIVDSADHVGCNSPESEDEAHRDEEVQGSSQASTSLFTSASDKDTIERAKWLEEEKEKEKENLGLELVSAEPGSGYATPRSSRMAWNDVVDSSQETVGSTPTANIKSRMKRTGKKATSLNSSPSKRQLLEVAGPRGNNTHFIKLPTTGAPHPMKQLKRDRTGSQAKDPRPRRKPRHHSSLDESYLPSSQKAKDRALLDLEATASAWHSPDHDQDSEEEDQQRDPTSCSPEDRYQRYS
ncbi:hypothetical protein FRC10_006390 [Ceratobasidium sp. 414]|nr:hypothetical protein FRC10_006390 [Ceratobasidium sp. 414]